MCTLIRFYVLEFFMLIQEFIVSVKIVWICV